MPLYMLYFVKYLKILFLEWPSVPSLAFWGEKEAKIRLFSTPYKKLTYHTSSDLVVLIVLKDLLLVVVNIVFMVT